MSEPQLRIAYLVNQYPSVSHSFIRREIRAVEAMGHDVLRVSVRGWDLPLVDPDDIQERTSTRYILKAGYGALFGDLVRGLFRRRGRFLDAIAAALAMSRNAVRPWPYHLIYLAEACRLLDWLEDANVTHLHAHFGTNPAEIAHLVWRLGGPTYSFTIHGRGEADGGARLHFDRKVGDARFVAAISGYTRSQLIREIPPALWNKVHVVHCGLDETSFSEANMTFPDPPVFLTVGRLSPEKGHLILLEAFCRLVSDGSDAQLVIAGDGDMRGEIETRIRALGLEDRTRITGWIDAETVRTELGGATALIQPSFIEGLPVVIMEAMAVARPVVATYVAGIPELVTPETGWLVPAGDPAALAEALAEVSKASPARLGEMGQSAQARVRSRHDIHREAEKLIALMTDGAGT